MFLMPNIELTKTPEPQYNNFDLYWLFSANSSIISLSSNNNSVKYSEHWITEPSDRFSFDKNNSLSGLELSIPNNNSSFYIEQSTALFGKLSLATDRVHTIQPMDTRSFSPKGRKLFCFNSRIIKNNNLSLIKLRDDLELILSNECYAGYILNNPLKYLTSTINGNVDWVNSPDDHEYQLMAKFLDIMSDNRVEKLGSDMKLAVTELNDNIKPLLSSIKSKYRKNILISSIEELLDFYC